MVVYPDYYPQFKCKASACRHSCCIGWEIDIDAASAERYRAKKGELGELLRRSMSEGAEPHFILRDGERCPLLNGDGLCELILRGGEEMLCGICADHPRFRTFLSDRTEIGIGLCCEAAAGLILGQSAPMRLTTLGEPERAADAEETELLLLRGEVIAALQDRSQPLWARTENALALCGGISPDGPIERWTPLFLGLERLDGRWTDLLERLTHGAGDIDYARFDGYMKRRVHEYEQLLVYFIYRHFMTALYDGDAGGKAAFAVLGTRLIYELGALEFSLSGELSAGAQEELARMFSAEIEYSQENLDELFDRLA